MEVSICAPPLTCKGHCNYRNRFCYFASNNERDGPLHLKVQWIIQICVIKDMINGQLQYWLLISLETKSKACMLWPALPPSMHETKMMHLLLDLINSSRPFTTSHIYIYIPITMWLTSNAHKDWASFANDSISLLIRFFFFLIPFFHS